MSWADETEIEYRRMGRKAWRAREERRRQRLRAGAGYRGREEREERIITTSPQTSAQAARIACAAAKRSGERVAIGTSPYHKHWIVWFTDKSLMAGRIHDEFVVRDGQCVKLKRWWEGR
jgi:hypothetical protein